MTRKEGRAEFSLHKERAFLARCDIYSSSHHKTCQLHAPKVWPKLPSPQKATVHHHLASWDGLMALDSQLLSVRK